MATSVQRRLLIESVYKRYRLPYAYAALEPHISAETMVIHYKEHYMKYLENLNRLMRGRKEQPLEDVLTNIQRLPDSIRRDVNFNGGGVDNHNVYWRNLRPGGPERPMSKLSTALRKFGGLRKFKTAFKERALEIQGSGWCWLAEKNGKLEIITTENQTSPRTRGWVPLLGIDMWEHAFYIDHRSDKKAYIDGFFKCVNWNDVARRLGA